MGSCSSINKQTNSIKTNIPPRPVKEIYYVRYAGTMYGTETYKIYIDRLTHEQLQYYIARVLSQYNFRYEYVNYDSLIIHNILPIHFNTIFANLKLTETIEIPAETNPIIPIVVNYASEDPV